MLVSNQIDVNARHTLGWTALMVAAVNGRTDICKLLLAKGADPNLGDMYKSPQKVAHELGLHVLEGII